MLAILSAGLFAGAALYINLVEHPARVECGTELAMTEFGPSYRRATVMQVTLAIGGLLFGVLAWLSLDSLTMLIGGLLIGAVIPFTLIAIFPTNKEILDPVLDKSSVRAAELLARWQKLHAVRTALSILSFVILVCSLA